MKEKDKAEEELNSYLCFERAANDAERSRWQAQMLNKLDLQRRCGNAAGPDSWSEEKRKKL